MSAMGRPGKARALAGLQCLILGAGAFSACRVPPLKYDAAAVQADAGADERATTDRATEGSAATSDADGPSDAAAVLDTSTLDAGGPDIGPAPDYWGGTSTDRLFQVTGRWADLYPWVCYRMNVNAGDEQPALDFWLKTRKLVEGSWVRLINLTLQSWKPCTEPLPQLAVTLTSSGPSSSDGLGDPGAGNVREIVLDIGASEAEVLYVFGRALGFEHEYGRHAWTGPCVTCQGDDDCTSGDRLTCLPTGYCGNPADHESIMAAPDCGGIDPGRRLTAWDALAAQRGLGRKYVGTVVDMGGRCMEIEPDDKMIDYPCEGTWNGLFTRALGASPGEVDSLRVNMNGTFMCATAADTGSGGVTDPFPIMSFACDPAWSSQDFQFSSVELRAMGNMCVAAEAASAGAGLRLTTCDAAMPALARFALRKRQIALAGTDLCVAVGGGGQAVRGAALVLAACDDTATAQLFDLSNELINYDDHQNPPACFNVVGALPTPGSAVVLWDACSNVAPNEVFYLTGPILAGGDRCLDLMGGVSDVPVPIIAAVCRSNAPNQVWDYHF
jgi:hypothetical protein